MCGRYEEEMFYSHVNYSVTKIYTACSLAFFWFYSHVNYSVTKIVTLESQTICPFYSHVNYSVTKISADAHKRYY